MWFNYPLVLVRTGEMGELGCFPDVLSSLVHHGVLPIRPIAFPWRDRWTCCHLLAAHIVCSDNEAFWVIIQQSDDLKEVAGLSGHPVHPGHPRGVSGMAMEGLKMMSFSQGCLVRGVPTFSTNPILKHKKNIYLQGSLLQHYSEQKKKFEKSPKLPIIGVL